MTLLNIFPFPEKQGIAVDFTEQLLKVKILCSMFF